MSICQEMSEKRRSYTDFVTVMGDKQRRGHGEMTSSNIGHEHMEQEKRVRREIANSNERRRMQSINAGFDSLRILLPPLPDGEKLSKATILQLTAKYINNLLMRLNVLENEVAAYRQAAGIQAVTKPKSDFHQDIEMLARKRKPDDSKKLQEQVKSRKRKVVSEASAVASVGDYERHITTLPQDAHLGCSPCSPVHVAPLSPGSPKPESTSSTAARLEHLVMAIEQIEGSGALNISPSPESPDESFSGDRSPSLPSDPYWHSPQTTYQTFTYTAPQAAEMKTSIGLFTDELIFTNPSTDGVDLNVSEIPEDKLQTTSTDVYPIVAKLLNRPIPHKYLHRPQVVVNSSH